MSLPEENHSRNPSDTEAGFTLLEILVVLAILGLLVGLVAPAALRQLGGARLSVAKQSLARIGTVLDMYKLDTGTYPSTDEGLEALIQRPSSVENWSGPYLKNSALPLDPWNHPYVYRFPSDQEGKEYDLCSNGPTGKSDAGSGQICNS
ncbi:type II secretion system major pseudopilin GspG [Acetobacter fallax]|uniref:Type II secretion system core protein G n=1 Tax=Acetobacter fallax TaxID=1737473 RepID=A0ABX0KCH9_9PROT|nr:type II secretion system major pseudopilin GspG [Acetobacter fallax]NHO32826.1 type II secretion system protein GspG [Acetobacter fallax]NHO36390.1 type II secretion system protein GspG [Acetobacter fallax]